MNQDNTTPDRVIELPVRSGYCTDCPHKAFEHEIGMNTPQSGRCLVAGCGCFSLNSPGRDELGDEVERLLVAFTQQAEEIERLAEQRDAYKELAEAYEVCQKEGIDLDALTKDAVSGFIASLGDRLHVLRTVLEKCRDEWDEADNGICAVCRIGHRLYDTKGNVGICEWEECLSHEIREALGGDTNGK